MNAEMLRYIQALRDMGATYIRIGATEVHFTQRAEPVTNESTDAVQQALQEALNQFHDAVDDQREVTTLEEKARRHKELEKLRYAHSG